MKVTVELEAEMVQELERYISRNGCTDYSEAVKDLVGESLKRKASRRTRVAESCTAMARWYFSRDEKKSHWFLIKRTVEHLVALPPAMLGIYVLAAITKLFGGLFGGDDGGLLGMDDLFVGAMVTLSKGAILIAYVILVLKDVGKVILGREDE